MKEALDRIRPAIQRFVRKFIPARYRDRSKAIVGGLGTLVQVVNVTVPDYSDEVKLAVGVIVAVLTYCGVYEVPNVSVDDAARGRGVPPSYQPTP